MNLKLYEAADDVVALLDQADPETGEYPPEFEIALAALKGKGQSVVAYERNLAAVMVARGEVIKRLTAMQKSDQRKQDWIKDYLQVQMQKTGITEIKASDGTFKAVLYRERDVSVDVFDERQVPEEYINAKVELIPDKLAIKKAIDDGVDVPGARIVKRDRLTIS